MPDTDSHNQVACSDPNWPRSRCKLIVEPSPLSGQENMDIDAELLDRVTAGAETVFVRIYRWAQPTVTLGYFQAQDEALPGSLQSCPRVRRLTGGGAILHHHEITYSCVLPASHPARKSPSGFYATAHTAIIELLSKCGAETELRGEDGTGGVEPWLCFLRKDPRDVVVGSDKVVGSAQRRRRGNILQHGSILLRNSPLTPGIPGLVDLHPEVRVDEFCEGLGSALVSAICR